MIFDDRLSMKQQVSKICQSAYLELCRISSIRHVLTVDATKTLVTSLVLSCLDYCNSLLSGIPQQLNGRLQKVPNNSALLIFKTSKCTHVSPLFAKLNWLPIAQRIDYKISSLCYDVVSDTAPLYLSDLLCLYVPSCFHCVPLLTSASFGFQQERKSSKGSVLSPISALSLGTNSPTLYVILKHNPSSKLS